MGRMEDAVSGTNEVKAGQKSEFSQAGQGLTCEEAPQQGSEGTQPSAFIQQEEQKSSLPERRGHRM